MSYPKPRAFSFGDCFTNLPPTSQGCQETEWRGLPSCKLFLAVQEGTRSRNEE